MPKPADLPTWATNENYATGVDAGIATRLEPTAGEKADGLLRAKRAPARKLNWILGLLCDWVGWAETEIDQNASDIASLTGSAIRAAISGTAASVGAFFALASSGSLGADLSVASNRIIVSTAGWYRISIGGIFVQASGDVRIEVYNTTTSTVLLRTYGVVIFGSGSLRQIAHAGDFAVAAGDEIGVRLATGSSGSTTAGTTASASEGVSTYLSVEKISAT